MKRCLPSPVLQLIIVGLSFALYACGGSTESDAQSTTADVFVKADPAVDAELEFSPGSLRLYFSQFPHVDGSSMSLLGPEGEIPLSGLHTMGEDDLMIGIDRYPLPAGQYTVQWTTRFVEDGPEFSGSYNFAVKAKTE